jgi:hypothetical protein
MTSKAKIAANRRNSKLSTGPSEEARERTRLNAVTHGLRSQELLLLGENGLELDALRETWMNRLNPRDPAEDDLVLDYVNAVWLRRRADRALLHYLKADVEQAANREAESVAGDIRGLFSDAQGGHHCLYATSTATCGGPTTSKPTGDTTKDPNEPSILVKRLESSEKGCLAMIEHWNMLRSRLEQGLEWQPQDRLKGIRMLGRQPLEVVEDQRVMLIQIGSFALHPAGRTDPLDDLKCELGALELEPFLERARTRWPLILDSSDTPKAKQTLFDLVDRNIERLEARVEVYRGLSAEGAASSTGRAGSGASIEADRLKRYTLASDRRAQRCLDAFYKFRREMGGEEEDGGRRAEDGGTTEEDGGRRAEDGGERGRAENGTGFDVESGVGSGESKLENQNLTSEANVAVSASEASELKEVAELSEVIEQVDAQLSALRALGIGPIGTAAAGGGKGWAAIAAAINAGGPLMRPIS